MTSIDTNVSNYTLSELMVILDMDEINKDEIIEKTNNFIDRYKKKDPKLAVFFQEIQSQLLQYRDGLEVPQPDDEGKIVVEGYSTMQNDAQYPVGDKQSSEWFHNQNLTQSDKNQTNKITNRQQTIQLFGNEYVPMNREQIATTDTYQIPVKQDSLNPNLKNTITRFVNLDSQFRQYTGGVDSTSTDYTLDLSDTLKDAISLRLYSYQIPFNWYAIDTAYGNTCLWIEDGSHNVTVTVSPGNYTPSQFVAELTNSFTAAGFYNYPVGGPVSYNSNNARITLNLDNTDFSGNIIVGDNIYNLQFTVGTETKIIFYDFTATLQCNKNCFSKSQHFLNNTLGWLMGYRVPNIYVIDGSGNTANSNLDLNGPKYLILVIDDYNQNHVNNGLVSITQLSNTLKLPTYYSPDMPYICTTPAQQGNNLNQLLFEANTQSLFDTQSTPTSNGLLIAGKYTQEYVNTQTILPSAPRTLTQSQLYTINEINKNRNNTTNYLSKSPTSSDILAMIPIKTSGISTGTILVEFSGSLQDNIRNYFGPVNIDRMAVQLLDDKGNVINLNGTDWCVTLICECLYQY
jgi:nitrate reductase NapAB chaperone NapD